MRLHLILLASLALAWSPATAGDGEPAEWTTRSDGRGDVRAGTFRVADAGCAYRTMADPNTMTATLEHLESVEVHADDGRFQDVTLTERFFPIGIVQSRYHRRGDGVAHLEWELISGRQARHDGYWQVTPRADGRADVYFENVIEAKSRLHQPLLRALQVRTMGDIAEAVQQICAAD